MGFESYLRDLLEGRRGGPENLVVLARIDSTNQLARKVVVECQREGASPAPFLVVAWEQTAGRGRRGTSWASPAGKGVYATWVLPGSAPEHLGSLPLLVAVGLARGLSPYLPTSCSLKWPNDLLVNRRKIGGILIESFTRGQERCAAVIGFGVNHSQGRQALPDRNATSLKLETETVPPLAELVWSLVGSLERELSHLDDIEYAMEAYSGLSVHRPGELLRFWADGKVVEGVFLGFDPRGFVRLLLEGREERLVAGQVLER